MSTATKFTQRLTLSDIPRPAKSVGAHLAAKLQLFNSDERTLTDELCDMLCIWLGMQVRHRQNSVPLSQFDLTLSKTTTAEEVKNGADLELIISSPLGTKKCLIQAKVLDPVTMKLRCDNKSGWKKLRMQLVAARNQAGDLAFLLVYIPGTLLNRQHYGYGTYEQQGAFLTTSTRPGYYGATLIPVDNLLRKGGQWINTWRKVPQISPGHFKNGIALWRIIIELLLCRRSTWSSHSYKNDNIQIQAFHRLTIEASGIDDSTWRKLQATADHFLRSDQEADSENDDI